MTERETSFSCQYSSADSSNSTETNQLSTTGFLLQSKHYTMTNYHSTETNPYIGRRRAISVSVDAFSDTTSSSDADSARNFLMEEREIVCSDLQLYLRACWRTWLPGRPIMKVSSKGVLLNRDLYVDRGDYTIQMSSHKGVHRVFAVSAIIEIKRRMISKEFDLLRMNYENEMKRANSVVNNELFETVPTFDKFISPQCCLVITLDNERVISIVCLNYEDTAMLEFIIRYMKVTVGRRGKVKEETLNDVNNTNNQRQLKSVNDIL